MEKFLIDEVSPEEEIAALLEYNGIQFRKTDDEFRFVLSEGNLKWETVCRWTRRVALIYGMYPFKAIDEAAMLERLNRINAELVRGCVILSNGGVTIRTDADLYDAYSAYESIARALEYNAGAMTKYWDVLRGR